MKIYRILIDEQCQSADFEATSVEEAKALAMADEREDWKDEYNDNNGWKYYTEEELAKRNNI